MSPRKDEREQKARGTLIGLAKQVLKEMRNNGEVESFEKLTNTHGAGDFLVRSRGQEFRLGMSTVRERRDHADQESVCVIFLPIDSGANAMRDRIRTIVSRHGTEPSAAGNQSAARDSGFYRKHPATGGRRSVSTPPPGRLRAVG